MHILLLGKNGQVGWELQRALAPLGKVTALDRNSMNYCGDLARPEALAQTVRILRPNVIVNAAAYTAVDQAECNYEQAHLINAEAVSMLAQEAEAIGALLVHYSTDYVFSGEGTRPWREIDTTAPLNTYGATKLAGEQAIIQHCSRHLIFRTSWVYAARGNNFAKTMLKLARERTELGVINDQIGTPTGAELIADCTAHTLRIVMIRQELGGLYHLTATGETSWYDYASFVFELARQSQAGSKLILQQLNPIPTSAYPTPAARPGNSRLNCHNLETTFGLKLPQWQQGVTRMINEILEQ